MLYVNVEKRPTPAMANPSIDVIQIRSYQHSDHRECREIFTEGMEQLTTLVSRVVFPRFLRYIAMATLFAILASMKWSVWILFLHVFVCMVLLALLYINVYVESWRFINGCLATDLKDIDESYMSNADSHMWVAERRGKVVGMVGLIQNKGHKPGVAEVQRMSVSSSCRKMGIARKLLDAVLIHAKERRLQTIVLSTTSAQSPAIGLYKKYGFKLVDVFPYPQKILGDLEYWCFDLQL